MIAVTSWLLVVSMAVMMLCTVAFGAVFFALVFLPYARAMMSGVPIMLIHILAMRLRRTDVNAVLKALILARQSGATVNVVEMERAYLQGVDLEKVTLAWIHARRENQSVTFQDLVDQELSDRLAEKLNR